MRKRHISAALAVAAIALSPTSAQAASARVLVSGLGEAAVGQSVTYQGTGYGRPYSGAFQGQVDSYDGSLPTTAGVCEPGTATLTITDDRGRSLELWSAGKVCAILLPLGVMQRFDGRFFVQSASQRGLEGTSGALDLRFLNGQADVYATSS